MIYFDNASTALPHPVLADRLMTTIHQGFANPSSRHSIGIALSHQLEQVREQVADLVRVKPAEVILTSGGTEANNLVLRGALKPGDHLITSAIEHASIHQTIHHLPGVEVSEIRDISLEGVLAAIRPNTKLVSIMLVNNETGQIFTLDGLYQALKERGIRLHRDAVQAFGKLPLMGDYDFLSLSGHKLGALKGTGALIARGALEPMMSGGDQERGLRPGTENVPGILSLGLVLEAEANNMSDRWDHVSQLNEALRQRLAASCVILSEASASPYILALAVPGVPSEVVHNAMSARQMYFSVGSACSARSKHHSHVISWLSDDPLIRAGAIRLSLSWQNTLDEVLAFAEGFTETIDYLRKVLG
ncbi:MAG TPA: cysteine desulfurase [Tissierellia bacterium]|nr:cysteine desulfurase [Tissierellia bacterium]